MTAYYISIPFQKQIIVLPPWAVLSHSAVSDSVTPRTMSMPGSSVHGNFLGKSTRVHCHALLQAIFPTQGLNPGLPHCRRTLYRLGHRRSPMILEWIAYPFSRVSSQPRNRPEVSCTAGGFFTS